MNFLKFTLGQLQGGETVRVELSGTESDVMLMTDQNLRNFTCGGQTEYVGGHYRSSPVILSVPRSGNWHAVVVPGLGGKISAKVSVIPAGRVA